MAQEERNFTDFQEGAGRLRQALAGSADCVPVFAQLHEFAAEHLGIPRREFFTRPDLSVPALLQTQHDFGIDVASVTFDVYNIEAEALGQKLVWLDGGMPDVDRTLPLIRDRADLARIRTPDFDTAGRFQQVIRMNALFRELTGLEPTLSFCAPFSLAANLRGIEQLLLDMHEDPEFARGIMDAVTEEVLAPWILYQKRCFPGATRISGADATASLPIVNLPVLRRWIIPAIERLRALCGPEVSVANWVGERCLPDPTEMLRLKLAVGPGALWGQDPDVESLGPSVFKAFAATHDVPLILGVGAGFLALATPAEVAARVREYVEVGGRGGRFALYLCNLGATTPPENLRAAVEIVHSVRPQP
jgi:Uroporphyrinogen decarboxylase (URO-D)